jgi:hypothetical protein
MDSHAPWYKSATFQGVIAILVARILAHCNLSGVITSDQGVQLVNGVLDAVIPVALAWIAHGRVSKPLPTLTLTKAAADAANADTKTEGNLYAPIQPIAPPAPIAPDSSAGAPAPKP